MKTFARPVGLVLLMIMMIAQSSQAQVEITDPADNASITIGAGSAVYQGDCVA